MATMSSAHTTGSNSVTMEQSNHESPVATSPPKGAKGKAKLKGRKIKKKDVKKRIKQLEKNLKTWHNTIMKFQESELSLDDMDDEDSPYIRTDYVMQRFVRDWESLCSLTGCSSQILVDTCQQPAPYQGTPHAPLNKKVQRIVNSDRFPDYQDVVEVVTHYRRRHSLPIPEHGVSSLAQTLFSDIGKQIKRRRRYDFLHHFGCHLTDVVQMEDDPSLSNPALEDQLGRSSRDAQAKLLSLIDEFASRQARREQDGVKEEEEEEEDSAREEEESNYFEHDETLSPQLLTGKDSEEEEEEEEEDEEEEDKQTDEAEVDRGREEEEENDGDDDSGDEEGDRDSSSDVSDCNGGVGGGGDLSCVEPPLPTSTGSGGEGVSSYELDSEGSMSEFLDTAPLSGLLLPEGEEDFQCETELPHRITIVVDEGVDAQDEMIEPPFKRVKTSDNVVVLLSEEDSN